MDQLFNQLLGQLRAAWRYRWHAVICAWITGIVGALVVMEVPARFEASARVYVDTQSVLRPLLAGLAVQPNVEQMVVMMSRTLISRPNVDRVITMADMDIKLVTPEDRERAITRLVRELTIKSAGSENLYTIAYTDHDPQLAKRVVQSLLTIFVEGSLGNKRKDADAARRFINEQLKTYNDRLVAAENAMTEFKRRHMDIMGDGKQTYYTRLAEGQAALAQASLDLREATTSRDAIRRQLDGEEALPDLIEDAAPVDTSYSETDSRLRGLQDKLDALRMSYTERHPDIVALVRMIDQLKEQKQREAKQKKTAAPGRRNSSQSVVAQQLTLSLTEADAAVASMSARMAEYQRRVNALKAAANAIPQVEAEYTQLTRDYEVTKKNYDALLGKLESAQISGSMESAGVMDFRVIDPPQVPSVPKAPNRPLLLSLALLVALAAGGGLSIVLSRTRPVFDDEDRLRHVTALPVFGTVPIAWTDSQTSGRRKGLVALTASFVGLLSAYGAVIAALLVSTARG
ncbi:MAG TPA: XrtA system polysaccharide chain length determinant [Burkholderiales bacterium]|nr:XrtA system polysaccharide chain length determinant [Burkholderiales bacterium]